MRNRGFVSICAAALTISIGVSVNAAPAEPVGSGQALQVFAGLAFVLALIAAASWGARRLQGFRVQGRGRIRVLEGLAVGTREKLLLVEVDGRRVLLGMCPGRIQTLTEFDGETGASATFDEVLGELREDTSR